MKSSNQIQLENIAETDFEIFALLKQRYSPRVFKNELINNRHLGQLFEAVRWSASSNNLQPWRFIYAVQGTKAYQKIIDCLSDFNKTWASNAPLLMLAAYKETNNDGNENFHALHDLGLSLGNMTLQAQYLGIGMHHMAGINWQEAHKQFKVPSGYHVATAIALGYYGGELDALPEDLQKQELDKRRRKPQESFAFNGMWEEK
ncbi:MULTISPECIES: nitroreductase family protein [Bizionia]|uniref:Nitroreductase n=1 Tax=Bizionia algoritergicola TaxID=291187 RepID=A0A5D0QRF6_9FLAO|nr:MULTISPECIES: nitroreductase family protein [Bizionia]OBX21137.1 nitroreductase [Bizionia sp. APA-3]TYB71727.1 nitroreductase [Bizionia algoritergicola]